MCEDDAAEADLTPVARVVLTDEEPGPRSRGRRFAWRLALAAG
jgi:hypothetical protein